MTWAGLSHVELLGWTVLGWGGVAFAGIALKRWPALGRGALSLFMAWVLLVVVPSVLMDGHPVDICADYDGSGSSPRECDSSSFRRTLSREIQASGFLRLGVWVLVLCAFALARNPRGTRV
jgi:hypothetical protein